MMRAALACPSCKTSTGRKETFDGATVVVAGAILLVVFGLPLWGVIKIVSWWNTPTVPVAENTAPSRQANSVSAPASGGLKFSCAEAGDFASLARRLRPISEPLDVGQLPMDESAAGFGMPPFPGLALRLEGALHGPQTTPTAWPAGAQAKFAAALKPILAPPAAS